MPRFFRVRNFETFQHYKDRNPPWIKLYGEILEKYEFCALPDASKWHTVAIWLLASRTQNRIPYDANWVAGRIGARSPVDLDVLVASDFIEIIQDAPPNGATRLHDASNLASKPLDQRREEKRQRRAEPRARDSSAEPEPIDRDKAREVITLFDALQTEIYNGERRTFPAGDDLVFADRWRKSGAELPMLEAMFRSKLAGRKERGERTIDCLRYFDKAVVDMLARGSAPIPKRDQRPARKPQQDARDANREIREQFEKKFGPTSGALMEGDGK